MNGSVSDMPQPLASGADHGSGAPSSFAPLRNGMPSYTLSRVASNTRPGTAARIAWKTSRASRVRFSKLPPNGPGRLRAPSSSLSR